jgi:Flp pilus assembly pilin Flp
MKTFLVSLLKDESGLTTVEYAVGAAVVTAGAIVAFGALGLKVNGIIDYLQGELVVPS